MENEFRTEEIEYVEYEGNRFLIDRGVLKDVQVENETVRIPEKVCEIRRQAFLDARLLGRMEALYVPKTVKKVEHLSFAGMTHLRYVELQAGIVTLEKGMFRNCMELEYILLPETLRSIESRAFENCLALTTVVLPRAWVQMSEDAFLHCVKLKDRRIESALESAVYHRKKEEEQMRRAKFPHLYQEENKTQTEKTQPAQNRTKVSEPPERQEISPDEKVRTTKVPEKMQTAPATEKSAAEELLEALLLEEQEMAQHLPVQPQTVQEEPQKQTEAQFCIHEGVLERCEVYDSRIIIPEGVTALADRVFYGRTELEEIIFPSTLSYIGVQALEGTAWLEKEREKNSCVVVNGILVSAFTNSMVMEATLPETVYRIAPYAFYHSEAQLVILPENVREIDAYAFAEAGVTEIDFSTRADVLVHTPLAVRCSQLKELYFPGQIPRLEENFVIDCPALRRVCLKWAKTVVDKKAFPENVKIWVL